MAKERTPGRNAVSFLLDTNVCSAHAKGDRRVFSRFVQHAGQLYIASITVGELTVWARRSPLIEETRRALDQFLVEVPCLSVDFAVGVKYGELRAAQLNDGDVLPMSDLLMHRPRWSTA